MVPAVLMDLIRCEGTADGSGVPTRP